MEKVQKQTLKELQKIAKNLGMTKFYKMKKAELAEAIESAQNVTISDQDQDPFELYDNQVFESIELDQDVFLYDIQFLAAISLKTPINGKHTSVVAYSARDDDDINTLGYMVPGTEYDGSLLNFMGTEAELDAYRDLMNEHSNGYHSPNYPSYSWINIDNPPDVQNPQISSLTAIQDDIIYELTRDYTEYKNRFNEFRTPYFDQLCFRSKKIPSPTSSDILSIGRGFQEISYVAGEQKCKFSCFIDGLIDCNYPINMIAKAFPDYTNTELRVSANEIINFCKGRGNITLYNLFDETIYSVVNEKSHKYKALYGYLNHQHFTIISDSALKSSLAHRAKKDVIRRTSGFEDVVKLHKAVTKPIVCQSASDLRNTLHDYITNHSISDNKGLPKIRYVDGDIYKIETPDFIYIDMDRDTLDMMKKIHEVDTIDTPGALAMRLFTNFCVENAFDCAGQIPACISDVVQSLHVGAKHFKYSDIPTTFAIDMNKCYSHMLKSARVFRPHVLSKINPYVRLNVHEPGIYNVKTNDTYLFRGNGHYTDLVLNMAIIEGIQFECDWFVNFESHSTRMFDKFVKDTFTTYGDSIGGKLVNHLVGCSYKKKRTYVQTTVSFSEIDAFYMYETYNASVKVIDENVERPLYVISRCKETPLVKTNIGIYIEVLNNSYISTYKKMKQIGFSKISYIATDALGLNNMSESDILNLNLNKDVVGGYKREPVKFNKPTFHNKYTGLVIDSFALARHWNHISAAIFEDFLKSSSQSIFIQGLAGTGKSYSICKFLEGKRSIRLAPTLSAAINIKGVTFHNYFDNNFCSLSTKQITALSDIDYLYVDELSMCNRYMFQILSIVKTQAPHIRMILSGDFAQLQPVNDTLDYENSDLLKYLVDDNIYTLTKRYRSTFDYNNVKLNTNCDLLTRQFLALDEPRAIVVHNVIRIKLNMLVLKKLNLKDGQYQVGMPLICSNTLKLKHSNNCKYMITEINGDNITMENLSAAGFETYSISHVNKNFQYAYAITDYKSQGQTFDFPYVIFESELMDDRHRYVAISRATKLEHIINASLLEKASK